jgi:hypothetical protein
VGDGVLLLYDCLKIKYEEFVLRSTTFWSENWSDYSLIGVS